MLKYWNVYVPEARSEPQGEVCVCEVFPTPRDVNLTLTIFKSEKTQLSLRTLGNKSNSSTNSGL